MTDKRKFDIRLSQRDFKLLERNARRCKISKSEYMRRLLNRCVPKEAPPADYYGMMSELRLIREDLDTLAQMAAATGMMDAAAVEAELRRLREVSEKIGMAVAGEYDEEE